MRAKTSDETPPTRSGPPPQSVQRSHTLTLKPIPPPPPPPDGSTFRVYGTYLGFYEPVMPDERQRFIWEMRHPDPDKAAGPYYSRHYGWQCRFQYDIWMKEYQGLLDNWKAENAQCLRARQRRADQVLSQMRDENERLRGESSQEYHTLRMIVAEGDLPPPIMQIAKVKLHCAEAELTCLTDMANEIDRAFDAKGTDKYETVYRDVTEQIDRLKDLCLAQRSEIVRCM